MINSLKEAIVKVDRDMVRAWVEELVVVKTFVGLKFQEAILKKIAIHYDRPYRLASAAEESSGIDGFIGSTPISIKPSSYKTKFALNESIEIPMVFYEKKKNEIIIEFDEIKITG